MKGKQKNTTFGSGEKKNTTVGPGEKKGHVPTNYKGTSPNKRKDTKQSGSKKPMKSHKM